MEVDSTDNSGESPLEDRPELSQFIENMGLHYEAYGVPRIGGRLLGLLMISHRPLAAEEMSETIQVSRSSVSTNLRTLQMAGLIEKVSLPGERYDYYVISETAWQSVLEMRLEGITALKELAETGLEGMEAEHPARRRLVEMKDWADMVEVSYRKMIDSWQSRVEETA